MVRWINRWSGLLARLILGGVWIYAGALKVTDPESSVTAVRAYQLLPTGMADAVGRVLPMLELVIGACLILGLLTRITGGISGLLQIAFIVGIASVWARGIEINCGCFGDGGPNPDASSQYPWEIARDVGLLALSALLVLRPSTPFSIDRVLFPATEARQVSDVEEEA